MLCPGHASGTPVHLHKYTVCVAAQAPAQSGWVPISLASQSLPGYLPNTHVWPNSWIPGLQDDVCAQHLSPCDLALTGCQASSLLHPAALPVPAERALLSSVFTHLYLSLPITSRSGLSLVCSVGGLLWLLCSLSWVWGLLFSATLSCMCPIVSQLVRMRLVNLNTLSSAF